MPDPGGLGLGPLGFELFLGAETAVCLAFRQQSFRIGLVPGGILALEVRSLIPGDAQPAKAVQNDPGVLLGASLPVGVLDAKDVGAAGVLGV